MHWCSFQYIRRYRSMLPIPRFPPPGLQVKFKPTLISCVPRPDKMTFSADDQIIYLWPDGRQPPDTVWVGAWGQGSLKTVKHNAFTYSLHSFDWCSISHPSVGCIFHLYDGGPDCGRKHGRAWEGVMTVRRLLPGLPTNDHSAGQRCNVLRCRKTTTVDYAMEDVWEEKTPRMS